MRILIFDIETSPTTAAVWGLWKQNIGIDMIQSDWFIMSFSAKWLGSEDIIYDDCRYTDKDDTSLLLKLHKLLDQADIVVAHNAIKFDVKRVNARFLSADLPPPSPYKVIDTLQEAKKNFAFTSNKLAFLTDRLTEHKKMSHAKFPGYKLWEACLSGNMEAWDEMKEYNKMDVISLEELYLKMRPWIKSHPIVTLKEHVEKEVCPKCGSYEVQKRGVSTTQTGVFQRYSCNSCGGWSRSRYSMNTKSDKELRLTNAIN